MPLWKYPVRTSTPLCCIKLVWRAAVMAVWCRCTHTHTHIHAPVNGWACRHDAVADLSLQVEGWVLFLVWNNVSLMCRFFFHGFWLVSYSWFHIWKYTHYGWRTAAHPSLTRMHTREDSGANVLQLVSYVSFFFFFFSSVVLSTQTSFFFPLSVATTHDTYYSVLSGPCQLWRVGDRHDHVLSYSGITRKRK